MLRHQIVLLCMHRRLWTTRWSVFFIYAVDKCCSHCGNRIWSCVTFLWSRLIWLPSVSVLWPCNRPVPTVGCSVEVVVGGPVAIVVTGSNLVGREKKFQLYNGVNVVCLPRLINLEWRRNLILQSWNYSRTWKLTFSHISYPYISDICKPWMAYVNCRGFVYAGKQVVSATSWSSATMITNRFRISRMVR